MTAPVEVGSSPNSGGPRPLLPRVQFRVLRLLAEGSKTPEIADQLGVSEVTVRGYVLRLRRALDARTTAQCIHRAHQLGLLDDLMKTPARRLLPQEMQVLRMVASGRTNSEIAAVLRRPEYTVAEQVRQLRARLGARDRGHAVALAMAQGVLTAADVQGSAMRPAIGRSA
ncbi:response regulator transcription factor [Streptomyces sp. NPDC048516]|uniref:response regulator transcription factor n=1 Tax=Streptomyces sp. NPDC048516 TaxID=3365565 RepID=UPI0037116D5D